MIERVSECVYVAQGFNIRRCNRMCTYVMRPPLLREGLVCASTKIFFEFCLSGLLLPKTTERGACAAREPRHGFSLPA